MDEFYADVATAYRAEDRQPRRRRLPLHPDGRHQPRLPVRRHAPRRRRRARCRSQRDSAPVRQADQRELRSRRPPT
jgi:hypothetical protein